MKLGALGEDRLLDQIFLHLPRVRGGKVFAGLADDCAIVETPRGKKSLPTIFSSTELLPAD